MNNKELLDLAKKVSEHAYCVYSKFAVGACVLYDNGHYYLGCNVENSSYGLSLCAERNAISNAVSCGEKGLMRAVAIYSPNCKKCLPCGACRQWISEFEKTPDFMVVVEGDDDNPIEYSMESILPNSFNLIH